MSHLLFLNPPVLNDLGSRRRKVKAMAMGWNPARYNKDAAFVYESVTALTTLLLPRPGERILDLGCGSGELTQKIRDAGCEVIGIDTSPDMISAALEKGLNAHILDGHDMNFDSEFDAVFSNAALHWMRRDPRQIVQSGARDGSLKPGGRFVAEFGGEGNVESIVQATITVLHRRGLQLAHPWYFPSKEAYVELLESEGFSIKEASLFPRDTRFPSGPVGWLEIFGEPLLIDLAPSTRQEIYLEVAKEMEPLKYDDDGTFLIDYVRLRLSAVTSVTSSSGLTVG